MERGRRSNCLAARMVPRRASARQRRCDLANWAADLEAALTQVARRRARFMPPATFNARSQRHRVSRSVGHVVLAWICSARRSPRRARQAISMLASARPPLLLPLGAAAHAAAVRALDSLDDTTLAMRRRVVLIEVPLSRSIFLTGASSASEKRWRSSLRGVLAIGLRANVANRSGAPARLPPLGAARALPGPRREPIRRHRRCARSGLQRVRASRRAGRECRCRLRVSGGQGQARPGPSDDRHEPGRRDRHDRAGAAGCGPGRRQSCDHVRRGARGMPYFAPTPPRKRACTATCSLAGRVAHGPSRSRNWRPAISTPHERGREPAVRIRAGAEVARSWRA